MSCSVSLVHLLHAWISLLCQIVKVSKHSISVLYLPETDNKQLMDQHHTTDRTMSSSDLANEA